MEKKIFLREKATNDCKTDLSPMSECEFREILDKYPFFLGDYYKNRWPYLEAVIALAGRESPKNILEVGSSWLPLFKGSDVIERKSEIAQITYVHDLKVTPWPIMDLQYDLLIATQVWEHLGDKQCEAFREVMRISKKAILSFPYKWKYENPDNVHHMIDEAMIEKWTLNIKPVEIKHVEERVIYLFKF